MVLMISIGPSHIHTDLIDAAAGEFERFSVNKEKCSTSLRFDLRLAESSVSHLRLDLDMSSDTKRAMAWKLTGPRHRAAELNTIVVQT